MVWNVARMATNHIKSITRLSSVFMSTKLAKKSYIDRCLEVNSTYINLNEACDNLNVYNSLFLIIAKKPQSSAVSFVIAYWDITYIGNVQPNVLFSANNGMSYTACNETGTIAFDTKAIIRAVPLY